MAQGEAPDHVRRNRENWEKYAAEFLVPGEQNWRSNKPTWGIWDVPEEQLHIFPDNLEGKDVVELGCGTGYVSSWMVRRGAKAVGVDLTWNQLATAVRMKNELGVHLPLVQANAEQVPLRDESFDIAISEYGACLWCDPYRWIPEAARLLRPGGELIFLTNGTILMLCMPDAEAPAEDRLIRDYFGMHRFEWADDPGVEFHVGYGEMLRLLRGSGFEVTDFIEIRAPEGATTRYSPYVTPEWARRWPSEEVWKARKVR